MDKGEEGEIDSGRMGMNLTFRFFTDPVEPKKTTNCYDDRSSILFSTVACFFAYTHCPLDISSDSLFWPRHNNTSVRYPKLTEDKSCDIAIIGGGVVGALVGYQLAKAGLSVTILERDRIGLGSTSASTALILYELDENLIDLQRKLGKEKAGLAYALSLGSFPLLEDLLAETGIECGFQKKRSIYLSTDANDDIEAEYAARNAQGFDVRFLDANSVRSEFALDARAAIVSSPAAVLDPLALTRGLIERASKLGANIFEQTDVKRIERGTKTQRVETDTGYTVRATHVIVATGYESQSYLEKPIVDLKSSYVIVSEPVPDLAAHWLQNHVLWETARPYLYVRTTSDHRIMVGGGDEDVVDPQQRDALLREKSERLLSKFRKLLPDMPFALSTAWAGTFGETRDGLGFIGSPKEWTGVQFALGFGGNGINMGIIAADILSRCCQGNLPKEAALFSFERKTEGM